ncbi:MAG TPA: alpha/beta hydrolase [Mycobacteriales bacterium]|nr:alpha/beta hydrolase [Mycobacteriales bacterium]
MTELHPDLRRIARFVPREPVGPRSLPFMRAFTDLLARVPAKGVERLQVGPIGIRLYRPPAAAPRPALLWLHGGGFVFGAAAQDDRLCLDLSKRLGIVVASVDYRLAPQHPFPTPLEDCFDALTWLGDQPYVDTPRLAVGGASAGGNLAAALSFLARDRGVPLSLQLLSYPMLDDRTCLRTDIDERLFRAWNNRANAFGWRAYTGREPGADDIPELASVARATNLAGLAPAWIGVGTADLFYEEDLGYADRLRAAGVACEVNVVDGAFHGFDTVAPKTGVTKTFRDTQAAALSAAFGL